MFITENELHLKEILRVLHKEGVLDDLILIGSWCLYFYHKVLAEFEPLIRTTDIDFYVPNAKRIKEKDGVIKSLKEINYDVVNDTITNKTRFISPDGFELEFLTKINREQLSCVRLGNTGIYAESLPHLDIFSGNYIEVNYDNMIVKVASPGSYVLQKLLINCERKEKSEKDIESVKHILLYSKCSEKLNYELRNLFHSLPLKWKKKINRIAKNKNIDLFEEEYK